MIVITLALKIKHRINNVFERFRPRDAALFGDMTNQKNRHGQIFGEQ